MTDTKSKLRLRPTTAADEALVLAWRNDPFLASRGPDCRSITATEHSRWFYAGLAGNSRRLDVIEVGGDTAGCVRFDRVNEKRAVISVGLFERFTGQGYGTIVIREATAAVVRDWEVSVIACVREDNSAAMKSFVRAGYVPCPEQAMCPSGQRGFIAECRVRMP